MGRGEGEALSDLAAPLALGPGRRILDPHRQAVDGAGNLVGPDRDRPAQGGAGAHNVALDEACISNRLALAHLGDPKGNRHPAGLQLRERQLGDDDLALDRFFPRQKPNSRKLQRRDFFALPLAHLRRIATRRAELVNIAHDDLQEAHPHLDRSLDIPAQQALRLHMPWVAAFSFGPGARKDAAEGPALPILYRRRPIGIEDVALVKDGAADLGDPIQIHRAGSADAASSSLCKAASKVGKPRCRL